MTAIERGFTIRASGIRSGGSLWHGFGRSLGGSLARGAARRLSARGGLPDAIAPTADSGAWHFRRERLPRDFHRLASLSRTWPLIYGAER